MKRIKIQDQTGKVLIDVYVLDEYEIVISSGKPPELQNEQVLQTKPVEENTSIELNVVKPSETKKTEIPMTEETSSTEADVLSNIDELLERSKQLVEEPKKPETPPTKVERKTTELEAKTHAEKKKTKEVDKAAVVEQILGYHPEEGK